uniref:Uncharacterized protein n=1 Tax=Nelumbo nucifera TaxID=4432 RepID=A0A822ZAD2_NELNU|nr:TPA_asm: hypothetical protein HUJ06_014712 [Nelumbo nucifera]
MDSQKEIGSGHEANGIYLLDMLGALDKVKYHLREQLLVQMCQCQLVILCYVIIICVIFLFLR